MNTSLREIAEIFSFVVREVDRINSTVKHHPDILQEVLGRGGVLQKQKDEWNAGGYLCGPEAISRLFKLAKERVNLYQEIKRAL